MLLDTTHFLGAKRRYRLAGIREEAHAQRTQAVHKSEAVTLSEPRK